jgi:hypothetical protein
LGTKPPRDRLVVVVEAEMRGLLARLLGPDDDRVRYVAGGDSALTAWV